MPGSSFTDGCAGHHYRTRNETGRLRLQEQEASARIGGYEFEPLKFPDGHPPREACLQVTSGLLAALWEAIRRSNRTTFFARQFRLTLLLESTLTTSPLRRPSGRWPT